MNRPTHRHTPHTHNTSKYFYMKSKRTLDNNIWEEIALVVSGLILSIICSSRVPEAQQTFRTFYPHSPPFLKTYIGGRLSNLSAS